MKITISKSKDNSNDYQKQSTLGLAFNKLPMNDVIIVTAPAIIHYHLHPYRYFGNHIMIKIFHHQVILQFSKSVTYPMISIKWSARFGIYSKLNAKHILKHIKNV